MQRVVVYSSDSSRSARIDQPLVRQSVTPGSSRYSSGQIQQQHRSSPNVYTASAGVHRPSTVFFLFFFIFIYFSILLLCFLEIEYLSLITFLSSLLA